MGRTVGHRADGDDRGRAAGRGDAGDEPGADRRPGPAAAVEVDDRPAATADVAAGPSGIDPGVTAPAARPRGGDNGEAEPDEAPRPRGGGRSACSQSQMRRFIKSRAYVPLHELRRRFAIDGVEDDVARIEVEGQGFFVGLPRREADILRELIRSGEVGMELLLDPESPVIVGVFPMRPVPRA